jgi:hypothetical protein
MSDDQPVMTALRDDRGLLGRGRLSVRGGGTVEDPPAPGDRVKTKSWDRMAAGPVLPMEGEPPGVVGFEGQRRGCVT